ncbi:hypothetical protein BXZ70DRAFT_963555 [Cristinia sonorae]|uniref:Uncharacterized protein n=1 Tax=Cristinia sonorae TaxID=1940300 RepID=A0A8K0UD59_9AGAR|nr:hypothetical protein BXZ70DRAFT_963555 [Cristinia sonorae]
MDICVPSPVQTYNTANGPGLLLVILASAHTNLKMIQASDSEPQILATPTSSISSRFPVEVWECILDFCAWNCEFTNDSHTLYACTLTCRAWLPRSRMHLYHMVNLYTEENLRRFLSLVRQNPIIGSLVYELSLGPPIVRWKDLRRIEVEAETSTQSQSSALASVHSISRPEMACNWICLIPLYLLPLLPKLYTVRFRHLPYMNDATQKYLTRFRTNLNIRVLSASHGYFTSCRDLAWFASCFPAVEQLRIGIVKFTVPSSTAPTFTYRSHPVFTHLHLWKSAESVLQTLLSWPSLEKIEHLSCDYVSRSDRSIAQFFLRVISLQRLSIQLFNSAYPLPDKLNLTASAGLRELKLFLMVRKGSERFLESLRLPSSLSFIALALQFDSSDCGDIVPSLGWEALDVYLTKGFPLLKDLDVFIHEAPLTAEGRARVYGFMAKTLPGLRGKGIGTVHYRTHKISDEISFWH